MYEFTSEHRNCQHCQHWAGDWTHPAHALRAGARIWVGQCTNQEDEEAPFAEVTSGEAFVFTPATSVCPAYALHPSIEADLVAEADHRASLNQELLRDAWA